MTWGFERLDILLLIPAVALFLIFLIKKNFVRFRNKTEYKGYLSSRKGTRILIFVSRTIIFSLLIIALSEPFNSETRLVKGEPKLTIFVDESESMKLFDTAETVESIKNAVKSEIPVETRTVAFENRSALGDAILNYAQGDDSILLVSDGNSHYGRSLGDVMLFATKLNTTISALDMAAVRKDALVRVDGPSITTVDTDTEFFVVVDEAADMPAYVITVEVDDKEVFRQSASEPSRFSFTVALTEGYHKIKAEINSDDYFKENNVFYKVVKVEPKPKVLLVSQTSSPLQQVMSQLYDLSTSTSLSYDYQKYSAIVLNNMPESAIPVDDLAGHVADGNGLVVVGGKNSFDRGNYKGSVFESLLPVVVGTGTEDARKDVNIVILLDISGTSSARVAGSDYTKAEIEKALALDLLKELKSDDKVAVIAFHTKQIEVSSLSTLSQKVGLEEKIGRIFSQPGPGTLIGEAIVAARKVLAPLSGSKNIILISDGLPGGPAADDVYAARIAAQQGTKVYAIQVGDDSYGAEHLKEITEAGNGVYFKATESTKLRILFGEPEQETDDTYRMEIINGYHFITRNLLLSGEVTGFNFVVPKPNADLLVATATNNPLLSAWRFGLGRIAVLSTDDGSAWAGQMLSKQNSKLITKTVNWAVGDLSRNKEFDVNIKDIYLGEEMQVAVISKAMPVHDPLKFSKTGENLYTSSFVPEQVGFEKVLNGVAAVNYNKELSAVGLNPQLYTLVFLSNGEMFQPDDYQSIIDKVENDARRMETTKVSYSWVFIIFALTLFIVEVAIRKIGENRNLNK
ncbi:VWA domain-containing protein [Candidatus Woesearchaeota archaeon]|nr:VWA domain-containing protein [Candidatus Woesearchaeota archaeon]